MCSGNPLFSPLAQGAPPWTREHPVVSLAEENVHKIKKQTGK